MYVKNVKNLRQCLKHECPYILAIVSIIIMFALAFSNRRCYPDYSPKASLGLIFSCNKWFWGRGASLITFVIENLKKDQSEFLLGKLPLHLCVLM